MSDSNIKATVLAALIGLLGSIVVAVISNWDKLSMSVAKPNNASLSHSSNESEARSRADKLEEKLRAAEYEVLKKNQEVAEAKELAYREEVRRKAIEERQNIARITIQQPIPVPPVFHRSPSFDCRKAITFIESEICSNPQLSEIDALLGDIYKEARNILSPQAFKKIQKEELQWIIYRDNGIMSNCIFSGRVDSSCATPYWQKRIEEIKNQIR